MNENKLTEINSKFYQKCEVIMLPTEKANKIGSLVKCPNTGALAILNVLTYESTQPSENQHLYILSSEEIKEGDLCLIDNNVGQSKGYQVLQCKKIDIDNGWYYFKDFKTGRCKKIIATTDKYLSIKKPSEQSPNREKFLPRPSDDFIKAFVEKQGKIDKVLVEYVQEYYVRPYFHGDFEKSDKANWMAFYENYGFDNKMCKLAYDLKVALDNTITIKPIQEEKTSWSREEVIAYGKLTFEVGRNFQLTGENNLPEVEQNL